MSFGDTFGGHDRRGPARRYRRAVQLNGPAWISTTFVHPRTRGTTFRRNPGMEPLSRAWPSRSRRPPLPTGLNPIPTGHGVRTALSFRGVPPPRPPTSTTVTPAYCGSTVGGSRPMGLGKTLRPVEVGAGPVRTGWTGSLFLINCHRPSCPKPHTRTFRASTSFRPQGFRAPPPIGNESYDFAGRGSGLIGHPGANPRFPLIPEMQKDVADPDGVSRATALGLAIHGWTFGFRPANAQPAFFARIPLTQAGRCGWVTDNFARVQNLSVVKVPANSAAVRPARWISAKPPRSCSSR